MPGKSDEYFERLDAVAFRLWRRVLPLLKWASREWLGKAFAVAGLVVAVAALAIGGLDRLAVIIAVLALLPTFGYALERGMKRVAMRRAAGPDAKIHPRDFLCAPLKLDQGYRLSRPADASMAQLYPYVDLVRGSKADDELAVLLDVGQRVFAGDRGELHDRRVDRRHGEERMRCQIVDACCRPSRHPGDGARHDNGIEEEVEHVVTDLSRVEIDACHGVFLGGCAGHRQVV